MQNQRKRERRERRGCDRHNDWLSRKFGSRRIFWAAHLAMLPAAIIGLLLSIFGIVIVMLIIATTIVVPIARLHNMGRSAFWIPLMWITMPFGIAIWCWMAIAEPREYRSVQK